jgi:hypothetical protein
LLSGWISQAIASAIALTRARPGASPGNSGGCGRVSSRYSMIAKDCVNTVPSSSSTGTSAAGFMRLEAGGELLAAFLNQMHRGVVVIEIPFNARAMRTRKLAELRK